MSRLFPCLLLGMTLSCAMHQDPLPLPEGFVALESVVIEPSKHGWIGIEVTYNDSQSLESLDYQPGVRIESVAPMGPAAAPGVLPGDILLTFDGTPVDDPACLQALLARIDSVRAIPLEIQRGSEVMHADVVVQVRGGSRPQTKYFMDRSLLRVAFEDSTGRGAYPRVAYLAPDSPFHDADVMLGDRILSFQGKDPGSAKELVRRIQKELTPGAEATFRMSSSEGEEWTVTIHAWAPARELTRLALWPLFQWSWDRVEGRESFVVGNFFLASLFRMDQVGSVTRWSFLTFFQWETGEARLEEVGGN